MHIHANDMELHACTSLCCVLSLNSYMYRKEALCISSRVNQRLISSSDIIKEITWHWAKCQKNTIIKARYTFICKK